MRLQDIEVILRALNDANVRFLIVGGLAVVAHGYVRYTGDIDLVLDLEAENASRAISALTDIGFQPLLPLNAADFANEAIRNRWRKEKEMLVFQMLDPNRPNTRVDLFVTEPFDFEKEYSAARREEIAGIAAPVLRLEALITMKRTVGRTQDLADIHELQKIAEHRDQK